MNHIIAKIPGLIFKEMEMILKTEYYYAKSMYRYVPKATVKVMNHCHILLRFQSHPYHVWCVYIRNYTYSHDLHERKRKLIVATVFGKKTLLIKSKYKIVTLMQASIHDVIALCNVFIQLVAVELLDNIMN